MSDADDNKPSLRQRACITIASVIYNDKVLGCEPTSVVNPKALSRHAISTCAIVVATDCADTFDQWNHLIPEVTMSNYHAIQQLTS
jgi:hypothetical protein